MRFGMDGAPDWALWQSFLAVVEAGSLSAAAVRLGQTQPTLGRQIRRLEADLGLALFTRAPRGLIPTEAALALVPRARAMAEAAQALSRAAAGQDSGPGGTVRLTASRMVALHVLPPVIADLRRAHPQVQIELVASDTSENLLFREADLALRMYRPRQLDIVARHLGDMPLCLCAADTYLARHGVPDGVEALLQHAFVGYDRSDAIIAGMRAAGLAASRAMFAVRCDDQPTYWALVCAGAGLGFGQRPLVRDTPGLREIPLPGGIEIPPLPVWLATPADLRRIPRVALVWDWLARAMVPIVS